MTADAWQQLRNLTAARIALGRAGGSLPTAEVLRFAQDHAAARDAVHAEVDFDKLAAELEPLGLTILKVRSRAGNRAEFVRVPDAGRRLAEESIATLEAPGRQRRADLVVVIADGLSALAVQSHAAPLLGALSPPLAVAGISVGALVLVRQGRVAIEDEIGQLLGATAVLMLIGERPGLSSPDSLGAYLVFRPRIGNTDADRNCVSNIRPGGLPIPAAAQTLAFLITESLRRKLSGTQLKDDRAVGSGLLSQGAF